MGRCASMRPEFNSRRSAVVCTRGIVGSSQPLATEAGLRVLRRGGNAADAAVAVAAALAVLEPGSTGIGGDFFALHYDAASREVRCVNGSGKSPKDLDAARVRMDLGLDEGYKGAMPYTPTATHSPHVVTVPGAIAGWLDCIERFGSGKLSFDDLMEDAIRLADEGFPVAPLMARSWKRARDALASVSSNGAEMLVKEDGADGELRAPRAGEVFRRPGLAKVLREVVAKGRDGFYKGWVAEAIVEELHAHGGVMTMEDLAEHATVFPEAISTKYSTVRVWEHPPNGDGLIALIALNILSVLEDQGRVSFESIDYVDPASPISSVKTPACLHAIIEALRIAFADGQRYISDPDKTDFHEYAKQLLSREHAEERASRIDMNKRGTDEDIFGEPKQSSNTVSFNVIDGEGNAVSAVNSNYMGFGSFLVPKGTGFTLQNRGHNFVLDEEHPNNLSKGGVRPFHTIIPWYGKKNERDRYTKSERV